MRSCAILSAFNDSDKRHKPELADVFHLYGEQYCQNNPLPPSHHKVMHAIKVCRTSALGGHLEQCDACGFERPAYNSCRNRHCPKCQALAKAKWLEARKAELLPVGYFHDVFTLPHELNPIALTNVLWSFLYLPKRQNFILFPSFFPVQRKLSLNYTSYRIKIPPIYMQLYPENPLQFP